MLQDEMQIGNSKCDDALICFVIACEWAACILSFIDDEAAMIAHNASDVVYCSVCACMQAQHKAQLDARDQGTVPTFTTHTHVTMNPPPAQQMVMMPQGAYAPQQQMGGQPMYYAQPQMQQEYPPQGYPQQQGYPLQGYAPQPGYPAQQGVVYNPMHQQQQYPQQQMYR